jgi:hypothetical protein
MTRSTYRLAYLLALSFAPSLSAQYIQQGPRLVGLNAGTNSHQGDPVAISGDGNTAITTSTPDDSVNIFVRSNGVWTLQQTVTVNDGGPCVNGGSSPCFGQSLALSNDGNIAIVGAAYKTPATYVLTRSAGVWTEAQKIVPGDVSGTSQSSGAAVAITPDGATMVSGDLYDNNGVGAIRVYARSGSTYVEQQKLVGSNPMGTPYQGSSVAISADGTTIAVGGPQDNNQFGAVWIFRKQGSSFVQQAKLSQALGMAGGMQGTQVSLSSDGNVLAAAGAGGPFVFDYSGSWQGDAVLGLFPGDTNNGSVAMSRDGNTVISLGVSGLLVFRRPSASGFFTMPQNPFEPTSVAIYSFLTPFLSMSADASAFIVSGSEGKSGAQTQKVGYVFATNQYITKTRVGTLYQGQSNGSYAIRVRNAGSSATSGPVTVVETPPAGFTVSTMYGMGWACSAGSMMCTRSDSAAAGGTFPAIMVTGSVAANAPLTITNTASVTINGSSPGGGGAQDVSILKLPGGIVQWGSTANGQGPPPSGLTNVVSVSAACNHSLALKADGTVVQWGTDTNLGTPPSGLTGVIAVSTGCYHGIALKNDGTIVEWGSTQYNQNPAPAVSNVMAISAGWLHSLALLSDGSITQWGDTSQNQGPAPMGVNAVAIAAGGTHNLAILSNGKVTQWGDSSQGQGTPPTFYNARSIAAGYRHSLALDGNGKIYQWGDTSMGEGSVPSFSGIPQLVAASPVGLDSMALYGNGTVVRWGPNSAMTPANLGDASAIAAGSNHFLAVVPAVASLKACNFYDCTMTPPAQYTPTNSNFYLPLTAGVTDQQGTPIPGVTVTFTAPPSGPSLATTTMQAVTDSNGVASISVMGNGPLANGVSGSYNVVATVAGFAGQALIPLVNVVITNTGGDHQSVLAVPGTKFGQPLQVRVTAAGNPVSGLTLGWQYGGEEYPVDNSSTTDANGYASDFFQVGQNSPMLGANTEAYAIIGNASGPKFTLTLLDPTKITVTANAGTPQATYAGLPFPNPLQAKVLMGGNPVQGLTVTFAAPASGSSAILSSTTAVTDANGLASVNATANLTPGAAYFVTANPGNGAQQLFSLNNLTAAALITGQTPGRVRNDQTQYLGMQFTVGPNAMSVYGLGRIYLPGNSQTHTVKLVYAASGQDVPGASTQVTMMPGTANTYQYAALASTIILQPNTAYFLVSGENAGGDTWYDYGPVTTTNAASVNGPVYQSGPNSYYQVPVNPPTFAFVPANLIYALPGSIPPPTVSITTPAANSNASGKSLQIAATASAAPSLNITGVQFKVDGNTLIGTPVKTAPYQTTLDTTTLPDGAHTLTAVATDNGGASTTSSGVTIMVNNGTTQPTGTAFVTGYNGTYLRNNTTQYLGMQFNVGAQALTVSALGRIYVAGNTGTHTVKLVNASNGQDVTGGSVQISMTGGSASQFKYVSLAAPLVLPANTSYFLVSQETAGGDQFYDYSPVTNTGVASIPGAIYSVGFSYVLVQATNYSYVPVNLLYSVSVATNTPPLVSITAPTNNMTVSGSSVNVTATALAAAGLSISSVVFQVDGNTFTPPLDTTKLSNGTHTLTAIATDSANHTATSAGVQISVNNGAVPPSNTLISGQSTMYLRNNATQYLGMQLTVGANALNVARLGRFCAPGNSATHTVKLVTPGTFADVAGGSVQVNMAGCTPGTYAYGNLANPVLLSARTSYYLVSYETANTDQFYDYAPVTSNGAASVDFPVYSVGSSYVPVPVPGYSYVPVNLQYNTSITPPPTVSVTSPTPNSTQMGKIAVTATATAASGLTITSVQFKVNGQNIGGPVTGASPYNTQLDTTTLTNGSYQLIAVATDSSGNSATSSAILIMVNNPVSSSGTAFVTGAQPSMLRNNFNGWVGMQFSVGGAPLMVSQLGRMCVPGSYGSHTLKLVKYDGTDLPNASATVNMAGCTAGSYTYSMLTNPIQLQANTVYYLMSQETNGDYGYDYSPVTTTSAGSVLGAVYYAGGVYNVVPIFYGSPSYCYIPLNFLYQ